MSCRLANIHPATDGDGAGPCPGRRCDGGMRRPCPGPAQSELEGRAVSAVWAVWRAWFGHTDTRNVWENPERLTFGGLPNFQSFVHLCADLSRHFCGAIEHLEH